MPGPCDTVKKTKSDMYNRRHWFASETNRAGTRKKYYALFYFKLYFTGHKIIFPVQRMAAPSWFHHVRIQILRSGLLVGFATYATAFQ